MDKSSRRTEAGFSRIVFFFNCFPWKTQRDTQASSSIRPHYANGRVGRNSVLTISTNCCFALFRSRRWACSCCCCLAAKGGLRREEVRGRVLLGELLSQPRASHVHVYRKEPAETVGGGSGSFSRRGWGCKLLAGRGVGRSSADVAWFWRLAWRARLNVAASAFLFVWRYKKKICCVQSVKKSCSLTITKTLWLCSSRLFRYVSLTEVFTFPTTFYFYHFVLHWVALLVTFALEGVSKMQIWLNVIHFLSKLLFEVEPFELHCCVVQHKSGWSFRGTLFFCVPGL